MAVAAIQIEPIRGSLGGKCPVDAAALHQVQIQVAVAIEVRQRRAAAPGTVLVCDRYSAYKKLGRELGDRLTLAFCWVHARRDFIKCAAGNETPAEWERR